MKSINKAKTLLEAVIVIAVTLAFVMPVTAATSKTSLAKIAPSEPKNIFKDQEWFLQATGFTDASRGINYVHCVDENIVWATAYNGLSTSDPCQDFTKTIDGGATWTPGVVFGADGLRSAMIFSLDANKAWNCMFAASGGVQGIYYTSNGGSTWTHQTSADFNLAGSFPDCVHFWDANVGWCLGDPVGGYYEIYTTTDGGTTWTRVPLADIPAPLSGEFGVTGYYDVVGDTIWFGTNMGRVFKSIDRGYHWTVSEEITDFAYIKPTFKDADNGLVIDLNSAANALLAETSDGGDTWDSITYSGPCYDSDMTYIPGTDNMYISSGAASGKSGASYSLDGGHSWTDYAEQAGKQMMNLDFTEGKIGWAGAFNTDETTGGIWKHIPSVIPKPVLTISITGGKGFTVTVKNIGDADATNVVCNIAIEGGLFVNPKQFSGSQATLGIGQEFTIAGSPKGIGLGILAGMPSIKMDATCDEGVSATKTAAAKIFFSTVTLQ